MEPSTTEAGILIGELLAIAEAKGGDTTVALSTLRRSGAIAEAILSSVPKEDQPKVVQALISVLGARKS